MNSVYVYDDRVVIFFNYKDGERCVDFSVLSDSENTESAISSNDKKTNTNENECSPLIKSGDQGGSPTHSSRTSTPAPTKTDTARKPEYLSSLYSRETGSTLSRSIVMARVDISKRMLSDRNMSIKEAAFSCGVNVE